MADFTNALLKGQIATLRDFARLREKITKAKVWSRRCVFAKCLESLAEDAQAQQSCNGSAVNFTAL
jgi:hypothetical protein